MYNAKDRANKKCPFCQKGKMSVIPEDKVICSKCGKSIARYLRKMTLMERVDAYNERYLRRMNQMGKSEKLD